jgi:hypothetical protein
MFNQVFGPSIYLLILDYFLNNPNQLVNLREIARSIGKNPGSVSRVVPRLIEEEYVEQIPVGNMYVFKLNENNNIVKVLLEFRGRLEEVKR